MKHALILLSAPPLASLQAADALGTKITVRPTKAGG